MQLRREASSCESASELLKTLTTHDAWEEIGAQIFEGKTSLQITQAVYPGLHWKLLFAAHSNVRNHLRKLAREGRARESGLGLWVGLARKD